MGCMGRWIARSIAGLAMILSVVTAPATRADENRTQIERAQKKFCLRLQQEAHKVKIVVPKLDWPRLLFGKNNLTHRDIHRQGYALNAIYFINKPFKDPYREVSAIVGRKNWRRILFSPGSPVPPKNRRLSYTLYYDPGGYWLELSRRIPDFMLRKNKSRGGHVFTEAPDSFFLYEIDIDDDGKPEQIVHRIYDLKGDDPDEYFIGPSLPTQYFDLIDPKNRYSKMLAQHNHSEALRLVRYRRSLYFMGDLRGGQEGPGTILPYPRYETQHLWFSAVTWDGSKINAGYFMCEYPNARNFEDWLKKLGKSRPNK